MKNKNHLISILLLLSIFSCKKNELELNQQALNEKFIINKKSDQPPTSKNVTERIYSILMDRLGVEKEVLKPETHLINDLHADELDLIEIVMDVKEEFSIEIEDDEAELLVTVKKYIDLVHSRLQTVTIEGNPPSGNNSPPFPPFPAGGTNPGGSSGGGSTGGGNSGGNNDMSAEETAEAQYDTDCESFIFIKTSIANWQEAGLNSIQLNWRWALGPQGGQFRSLTVNHIVFGLPTFYTNSNGSTTPLSQGQAANKAAQVVEMARNLTYTEFRNSPYLPDDATVIQYFKNKLATLMLAHRGTAGVNGSGNTSIIFKNEIRSHYTNPLDCQ